MADNTSDGESPDPTSKLIYDSTFGWSIPEWDLVDIAGPSVSTYADAQLPLVLISGTLENCTVKNIVQFLHGISISDIVFVERDGVRVGEAYVVFPSHRDGFAALTRHLLYIEGVSFRVSRAEKKQYYSAISASGCISNTTEVGLLGLYVNWLVGLDYSVTEDDICQFLIGVNVIDILFLEKSRGKRNGDAFVVVTSEDHQKLALTYHKKWLKKRWVEIYPAEKCQYLNAVKSLHVS